MIHEIAARTEAGGHDLVVMGSRGMGGLQREILGSVASGVLRAAWSGRSCLRRGFRHRDPDEMRLDDPEKADEEEEGTRGGGPRR